MCYFHEKSKSFGTVLSKILLPWWNETMTKGLFNIFEFILSTFLDPELCTNYAKFDEAMPDLIKNINLSDNDRILLTQQFVCIF